jgi:hypothetical protein
MCGHRSIVPQDGSPLWIETWMSSKGRPTRVISQLRLPSSGSPKGCLRRVSPMGGPQRFPQFWSKMGYLWRVVRQFSSRMCYPNWVSHGGTWMVVPMLASPICVPQIVSFIGVHHVGSPKRFSPRRSPQRGPPARPPSVSANGSPKWGPEIGVLQGGFRNGGLWMIFPQRGSHNVVPKGSSLRGVFHEDSLGSGWLYVMRLTRTIY